MTISRDDVIRMAREADPFGDDGRLTSIALLTPETLERFAALVAAAEREACAKVCDAYPIRDPAEDGNGYWAAKECAAAIRAGSSRPGRQHEQE